MATAFSVESSTPGAPVWSVDSSGNTIQSGSATFTGTAANVLGTVSQLTTTGVIVENNGINTSGSVNVLTPSFGVSAASGTQLSDTSRDYMVYVTTSAGGASNTLTIGSTSAATSATIYASATTGTGQLVSYRLPAGWFSAWLGATAIGQQHAVSC